VPLLERGEAEAEEAEETPGVHELGPHASASGVSPLVVVARVRKDRTCARLAIRHLHLAEQHPARGHDPLTEGYLRRRQDGDPSGLRYDMRLFTELRQY